MTRLLSPCAMRPTKNCAIIANFRPASTCTGKRIQPARAAANSNQGRPMRDIYLLWVYLLILAATLALASVTYSVHLARQL